jgi:flagellar hook-basal body complex protein FliE
VTVSIQAIAAAATSGLPSLPTLPTGAGGAGGVAKPEFDNKVVAHLEELQATHKNADSLATKAATGDISDAHDYMIAATQASLATEMTTAVRNKAVEAFTSIMSMQV